MASNLRAGFAVLLYSLLISSWMPLTADDGPKSAQVSVLHLSNGDYVTGTLVNSPDGESFAWQSPVFSSPFQFELGGVSSIHFTVPSVLPEADGKYEIELAGGEMLYGSLIGLDAETAILDVVGIGRLTVDRKIIQRISRRGGNREQIFVGPNGLNGWKTSREANTWQDEAGHLTSNKPGAVLKRDFGIPNQARFEIELSWKTQPDFELAIGVGIDPSSVNQAFKFEVLNKVLVVHRATESKGDIDRLQNVDSKPGRLCVQVFLDQKKGRMIVLTPKGEPLADLTVKSADPKLLGGIQLTNRHGDVSLERLQVSRWNGEVPRDLRLDKASIQCKDGTIVYAPVTAFNADKHELMIGDPDPRTIAEDEVQSLFFSRVASEEIAPRSLRAVLLSGMRISGDLVRVENQKIWLKSPGIQEQIFIALENLQSLVVLKPKGDSWPISKVPPQGLQRKGRLEINGITLHGRLVDSREDDSNCLNWQPERSSTSSQIPSGISGRIVYHDTKPLPKPEEDAPTTRVRMRGGLPQPGIPKITVSVADEEPTSRPTKSVVPVLHLRTGDTIECESTSLDENGLTFKSSMTDATFVSNEQIQALELRPDARQGTIEALKKERLLTVPRMQRDNPPTHLIRSMHGDYLRGRLVSMDEEQIQVELRLEAKIIRRDRVARILWLHPETLEPNAKPPVAASGENTSLVQAVSGNGTRLTFLAKQVEGSFLIGQRELLGSCRVNLQQIDQLLMGAAIVQAVAGLPFQWRLKKAAEPLAPKEGSEGSTDGMEGQESALVGKQAPDIALKSLDGLPFRLSDHQGKIVILDFWASWCGPCLQVMPQIDRVAQEFADQGVELFAVNLEEAPDKVKAALERLKLSPTVVLDRDGRVAEKYGATAIPQTVIIARDGKVARLFVGGGPRFDEQLRTALKAVLTAETPKTD